MSFLELSIEFKAFLARLMKEIAEILEIRSSKTALTTRVIF
jgi:hypothetical protein